MTPRATSLQSIADKAGVSAMTVSRVLRNSPHVSAATRRRVLAAARALRYRPDAHLARMMSLIRSRKTPRLRAVLAIIREDGPAPGPYQYVAHQHIERRAAQHGYRAEEFWLGRHGLGPERLSEILQARGIEGIIVSPQPEHQLLERFDYTPFAAATFGYLLQSPSLHRAAGNMTEGILLAMAELTARGYRRIGLAITRWLDIRALHHYSGAMLHAQASLPRSQRVP